MRLFPLARDAIRAMVDAGVELTAGTDAGIPNRPFDSLPASIAWFGSAEGLGMTPTEALATATTIAARACSLEDRSALRPGLRADLLAVHGNPLTTLADLTRTRVVVLHGAEATNGATAHA